MKTVSRLRPVAGALAVVALTAALLPPDAHAKRPDAGAASTTEPSAPAATASAVGLLPIHGILVDLDPLPGAGRKGNLDALQQLWDSYLEGAGFNVLMFEVDVRDLGEGGAGRIARLCEWATRNGVRIAPVLMGAPRGQAMPADYPDRAASFVGKVIATLGVGGASNYAQIVFYQLDRPLNHPATHGSMDPAGANAMLRSAAEKVRAAELAGLAQSGLQPTPLLASASFDYELVRRGAIAGIAISDEVYGLAYDGLRDYLLDVLETAPIEAASVEWFPGSLSSEGVDRLPDLINRLEHDLPGKLLIIDTGHSTAAGSDTTQARYYQVALNNMCNLRANQGVDSPFAGVLWQRAVDAADEPGEAREPPPAGDVTKAWNDPGADATEARSWLSRVHSGFGLLSRDRTSDGGFAPKAAFRVMSGLEAALSQSPEASDALAAVQDLAAAGKTGGMGQAIKSRLQTAMFGMLDAWLASTAENLFTPEVEPESFSSTGTPPPMPDLQIVGSGLLPAKAVAGTAVPLTITLFNAGDAVASDAAVYLRDAQRTDLARTNPVSIMPGSQTVVELKWTPSSPGQVRGIQADAFCSNDADPSPDSNRLALGDLAVDPAPRPPKPPISGVVNSAMLEVATRAEMKSSASPSTGAPPTGGKDDGGTRAMMATSSASGFATIEAISAPQVMMAPAPGMTTGSTAATSTRSMTGTSSMSSTSGEGAPRSAASAGETSSSASTTSATSAPAPPAEPVTMTLSNPFKTTFRDAVATLRVDDAVVSTRPLGTLLPGQQRTVAFTGWSPPRPGTYRLRADLEGVGVLGNRLTSSATSTITVSGQQQRSVMPPTTTPTTTAAAPVRSVLPTRSLAPLATGAQAGQARAPGLATRGFGRSAGTRALAAATTLQLSANHILLDPFPPAPGTPMSVSVRLVNLGGAPVQGARVSVRVDGEMLGETQIDVPGSGTATATGFKVWNARPGRHDVRASVTVGATRSEATKPMLVAGAGARGLEGRGFVAGRGLVQGGGKGGALTPGAGGRGVAAGRPGLKRGAAAGAADLQITPADIRFEPSPPSASAPMKVIITVRNPGGLPARDGRVLAVLTAGGTEVTRREFDAAVPAAGVLTLEWPLTAPPQTPIVVDVTATTSGDADPKNNQARATTGNKTPVKTAPRGLKPSAGAGTSR